jgi:hypothetical protein
LGQLAGVQRLTQEPFWHSVPVGQLRHATPPVPQAVLLLPARQVFPSQQPLGQLAGVQTQEPFWHSVPVGQLRHATPPVPQNSFEFPVRQVWVASSQQPLEQLAVVQMQEPF